MHLLRRFSAYVMRKSLIPSHLNSLLTTNANILSIENVDKLAATRTRPHTTTGVKTRGTAARLSTCSQQSPPTLCAEPPDRQDRSIHSTAITLGYIARTAHHATNHVYCVIRYCRLELGDPGKTQFYSIRFTGKLLICYHVAHRHLRTVKA